MYIILKSFFKIRNFSTNGIFQNHLQLHNTNYRSHSCYAPGAFNMKFCANLEVDFFFNETWQFSKFSKKKMKRMGFDKNMVDNNSKYGNNHDRRVYNLIKCIYVALVESKNTTGLSPTTTALCTVFIGTSMVSPGPKHTVFPYI